MKVTSYVAPRDPTTGRLQDLAPGATTVVNGRALVVSSAVRCRADWDIPELGIHAGDVYWEVEFEVGKGHGKGQTDDPAGYTSE